MNPHAISVEKNPNRVKVIFNGKLIADTHKALILREGKLPPVLYFPRQDVDMSQFHRTEHLTHCPFKGEAAYYTIHANGKSTENAAWTYETPIQGVEDIKNHLAFYKEKMDRIEELVE